MSSTSPESFEYLGKRFDRGNRSKIQIYFKILKYSILGSFEDSKLK